MSGLLHFTCSRVLIDNLLGNDALIPGLNPSPLTPPPLVEGQVHWAALQQVLLVLVGSARVQDGGQVLQGGILGGELAVNGEGLSTSPLPAEGVGNVSPA